jgi:hypothetical protein
MDSLRQEMATSERSQGMEIDDSLIAAAKGTSLERCTQNAKALDSKDHKRILTAECKEPRRGPEFKKEADFRRSEEKQKSNSTSTLYVRSTVQVPDVNGTLLSLSLLLHQMIQPAPALFDEVGGQWVEGGMEETSANTIFRFLKESYLIACWSPEVHIIAMVLITRLVGGTEVSFDSTSWNRILLCALMLAQKLWDDIPLANVDFPAIWANVYPDATSIDLYDINQMEVSFLRQLNYDVHVSRSTYLQFYFELHALATEGKQWSLSPLTDEQVACAAHPCCTRFS